MSRGALHLLFLHHLLLAFAARHAAQSGANSAAVSADWSRSARQTLQSIQLLWNPDEGNESEATENNTEVQLSQYLAVMALKSCTEMSSVNVTNGSVLELKRRLKNLCHLTKHTDIVERLGSLMSDDLVASWVCGGLSLAAKKLAGYELKQCRNAGKTVIGELKEMVKVQDYRKMATQLQLYAVKVAVVVLPLPPPLGRIIEQGVHLRLQRLAQDAGEELDSLEKKLDAKIRRTMSRELLRLGTAQARAAEEQVTEMLTLDGLLNDMVSKSSETSSQFATAMAQVTSFNRWAILEHDLATSSELLRPPEFMEDIEERTDFAQLMKSHLEMYMLVLAQMHRITSSSAQAKHFQATLTSKAKRMAKLIVPDLLLLARTSPEYAPMETLIEVFDSPLLSEVSCVEADPGNNSHIRDLNFKLSFAERCCLLKRTPDLQFEYLVTCVWMPLLAENNTYAKPLRATASSTTDSCFFRPDVRVTQFPATQHMEPERRRVSCPEGQVLEGISQKWEAQYFNMVEDVTYLCRDPPASIMFPLSFTSDGLCLDAVRLFQDNVVASLTMVEFDTSGSAVAGQFSWIKRSTCRLAVAKAPELYSIDWWTISRLLGDDHNSFLFRTRASARRPTGNLCDHCFWANPSLCVNPGSFTGSA